MIKLLDLTIKINDSDKYKNSTTGGPNDILPLHRIIKPSSLKIKDQTGGNISKLKTRNSLGVVSETELLVRDIKEIKIFFSSFDIPISWAWYNRRDREIEFTLKNLKYDEEKGLLIGLENSGLSLFLQQKDFEVEVFENSWEKKFLYFWQIIELAVENDSATFNEFRDLYRKILINLEVEQITNDLITELKEWNAGALDEKREFYELENINNNEQEVKTLCQGFLEAVENIDNQNWKDIGIKTVAGVWAAKENGFNLTTNPELDSVISEEGKYKGFYVGSGEKYQTLITLTSSLFSSIPSSLFFSSERKNRYTRKNIDEFRELFPNNANQSDPKYFLGFRPGDIQKFGTKFFSVFHQRDIKEQKGNFWEMETDEEFSRTYYELKSCGESKKKEASEKPQINEIIFRPQAFGEWSNKTKQEHWDIYWKWLNEIWITFYVEKAFGGLHNKLTKLLPLLDKPSFASENETNCEAALKVLQNYETPEASSDEAAIKNRFSAEIDAKKAEITSRIKLLISTNIDTAANEDYGSGQLSPERKRIFTAYRNQISNPTLLTRIKELIKLLVRGEKIIAETNRLTKMTFANQLKEEYQNGQGDKKQAYNIVNQVDNNWVDRTITNLGVIIAKKNQQQVLTERKKQLKTKYGNSIVAQAVFDSNVLDTVAALDEAEKLYIKVLEAETKNDTDASLLTFLQGYQNAEVGNLKNKAWQAVNGYNKQGEAAIQHLQKTDQSREEIIKKLQEAKSESELEMVYNQVRDNKLYKRGGKSKKVIDNLRQRKEIIFKIEKENISPENKNFLQTALSKIIPDTIKNNNDEQELTELENKLKTFSAAESSEKGKIYLEYKNFIDQILTEISQEKQRFYKAKSDLGISESSGAEPSLSRLPDWIWGPVIVGSVMTVGIIILIIIKNFRKSSKIE